MGKTYLKLNSFQEVKDCIAKYIRTEEQIKQLNDKKVKDNCFCYQIPNIEVYTITSNIFKILVIYKRWKRKLQ